MTYCEEYIVNAKYTNDKNLFSLIIQLSCYITCGIISITMENGTFSVVF